MKPDKGKSVHGPPTGSFKTNAVLIEESGGQRSYHSGVLEDNSIVGGSLFIDVMARDPYTGQAVRIEQVKVKQNLGSLVTGIPQEGVFELTCPSYEGFQSRDPTGITALPVSQERVVQNTALPQGLKVKDTIDNFSATSNSPVCRQYDENIAAGQRNLGLVHERDDINVLQGDKNGNSPGVGVNQKAGTIYLFGNDGKQNVNISPGGGVKVEAASVDMGSSEQELTSFGYGGMPQTINPMNNVIPQGTIVSPQPRTVPNVMKILNMVATIVDMVDLISACKEAIDVVKSSEGQEQNQKIQDVLDDAAGPSSLERSFMTKEEEKIASNPNMSQADKDAALARLRGRQT